MFDVSVVPILGAYDDGFLAGGRFLLKEELDVFLILSKVFNLKVECSTIFLRERHTDKKGNPTWRGAVVDFYLPELDVLIEVRKFGRPIVWDKKSQGKEPHKFKQRRLANEYGYGFAIVHRLGFYNWTTLIRKVFAAVMQAISNRDLARKRNPDWQARRNFQQLDRRYVIVVRETG